MDFPILDLLVEQACYDFLVGEALHPDGLRCPGCRGRRAHRPPPPSRPGPRLSLRRLRPRLQRLDRHLAPGHPAYPRPGRPHRAGHRPGTHRPGWPANWSCSRRHLLNLRHRLRARPGSQTCPAGPLPTARPKRTRCSRMRGKKGVRHPNPDDPPRRRANKRRGHGNFANDRPPVVGVVGRQTGQAQLFVLEDVSGPSLRASSWARRRRPT